MGEKCGEDKRDKRFGLAEVILTVAIIAMIILILTLKFGVGILFTPKQQNIEDNKDEVLIAYNVERTEFNKNINNIIGR